MAPRLKVYATRIGFHDVAVAAPNQKAALAAWDVREDLFAKKAAVPTDDKDAVKAALAKPGVVVSRAIGAGGPYTAERKPPPRAPRTTSPNQAATSKPRPARPPSPKKRNRTALDAAEAALDALAAEERQALAALAQERKAVDTRESRLRRELTTRRRKLERDRDRARRAYEAKP